MKRKIYFGFCALVSAIALLLFSSCEDQNSIPTSNNGSLGTLSFVWDSSFNGDTIQLFCKQTLTYYDDTQKRTVYPVASVKLWPKYHVVEYEQGYNPTPSYLRSSTKNSYEGVYPRTFVKKQEMLFSDNQIYEVELRSEVYSYTINGREQFCPHIEFDYLNVDSIPAIAAANFAYPVIYFGVPWTNSATGEKGSHPLKSGYTKKRVSEIDHVLSTNYSQGMEWADEKFSLYVEKTEVWQIAGTKTERNTSGWLDFNLSSSADKSIEVTNFDFVDKLAPSVSSKQTISNGDWLIKKATASQTVHFTNNIEDFEDMFAYPVYEASLTWEGRTFEFDLSVNFAVDAQITQNSSDYARNVTKATAVVCQKSFEATVSTVLTKKTDTQPIIGSGHGKVLDVFVSAVFDPAYFDTYSTSMTKKCVVVRYEKGYDWGICEYEQDFPSNFTFTQSNYTGFNSAAKSNASSGFELARVQESDSSILWYSAGNRRISGIDALTCKIYGWKYYKNGAYASLIDAYTTQYSNDSYMVTIYAPSGQSVSFKSSPN